MAEWTGSRAHVPAGTAWVSVMLMQILPGSCRARSSSREPAVAPVVPLVAALVLALFTLRHATASTRDSETGSRTRVHTGARRKRNEHRPLNDVSLTGGPMIILRQQMRSKPERTEDVWAALAAIVPVARATPGVITLDIARDLLDPDSFVATAVYDDAAAVERQESAPEVHAAMAMFPDALAAPPDRKFYDASRDSSLV